MLRSSGRWKPKKKVLALYCVWALILPNCGPRRTSASATPQTTMSASAHRPKARNAYRSIKPKDLSQHIRAVYSISERNHQLAAAESFNDRRDGVDPETARLMALVADNPGDAAATRELADRYFAQERFLDALELYSRLEKEDPQDRAVQKALALVWDAWGNYPTALEHATRALQAETMNAADWAFLGRIHLRGSNFSAAVSALRQAADLEPFNSLAFAELGDAYYRVQDWKAAADALRRAIQLDGGLIDSRRKLALSLVHLQLDEEAAAQFLSLGPAVQAYNDLGSAQAADRRWEAASRSFAAALTADPSSEEAQRNLARTEIYRPLERSVTLPSFDLPSSPALKAALVFPEPATPAGVEATIEPGSRPPARRPFILELENGRASLEGVTQGAAKPLPATLPSPVRVLDNIGNIEAIVQLPGFPTTLSGDGSPERRETGADTAGAAEPAIPLGPAPLSLTWEPTVVELSAARPVTEVLLPEGRWALDPAPLDLAWTAEPVAMAAPDAALEITSTTSPTVWSRLEGTRPPVRYLIVPGGEPSAGGRPGDQLRPLSPAWELRPLRPSAAAVLIDQEVDYWRGDVSAVILDNLGKMARMALPDNLQAIPVAAELPAFRPITVGELSPVFDASRPRSLAPIGERTREEILRTLSSPKDIEPISAQLWLPDGLNLIDPPAVGLFGSNLGGRSLSEGRANRLKHAEPRLVSVSRLVRQPAPASGGVAKPRPQASGEHPRLEGHERPRWSQDVFPLRFARMPGYDQRTRRPESNTGPLATGAGEWKLAFLTTIGAGLLGTAVASCLGLGVVATVLVGVIAGLTSGAVTLAHTLSAPRQAQLAPPRNRGTV